MGLPQHLANSVEHYTPSTYIDPARDLFGGCIDLDPASCELANEVVQAEQYFSLPIDGLVEVWNGNVWCNPPYGWRNKPKRVSNKEIWSRRVVHAYETGEIEAAVLLLTATPAETWFKQLWSFPICFPDHRIGFWGPTDGNNNPGSNAIFYIGPDIYGFASAYDSIGRVVMPDTRYRDPNNSHKYQELLKRCGTMPRVERRQLSIFEGVA